jgi:hypothetical protein
VIDRYTRIVLTVIACALVYICIAITPLPSLFAQQQQSSRRPGESTGPAEVVIVGWKQDAPMQISSAEPLRVVTERSSGGADRVVIVGYEENAQRERAATFRAFSLKNSGIPVTMR